MEAQIAQWQSAYTSKDDQKHNSSSYSFRSTFQGPGSGTGANTAPLGGARQDVVKVDVPANAHADSGVASIVSSKDGKPKTVVRSGGGQTWQDSSLLEWDPAHFRLFVGNLAGEVTDDSLLKAFAKYTSVQKARVIRDKRTTKSKGYGFISFSDGEEYFQAGRDMEGKYIGSHPVQIKRSNTEIRPVVQKDKNLAKGGKNGKFAKGGQGRANGSEGGANLHASTGAGVQKKQSKTKGGLRVLG